MKEAIFQPFWFVFFFSFIRMKRGWIDSTVFKFQTENQPNKQTTSTELLYGKSIKRQSGLKHFTVYWFYSLFLEISIDDLIGNLVKLKTSQTRYDKKLNLGV